MATKKKMGRPALDDPGKQMQVRITDAERDRLQRGAELASRPGERLAISTYMRMCALADADKRISKSGK
jgi:hypothetical protein